MNTDPITDENAKQVTIRSYNEHVEEYIDKVSSDDGRTLAYWPGVTFFLDQLAPGQEIFEIGSGSGGDALRFEGQGFTVYRTDVSDSFLKLLRANGHAAERYDALTGVTPEKQTAIFANAVFLHFTGPQFRTALANVHESLKDGGLFCLGMKLGDFEGWREKGLSGKRYFKFWQVEDLETELAAVGFKVMNVHLTPIKDFAVITASRS